MMGTEEISWSLRAACSVSALSSEARDSKLSRITDDIRVSSLNSVSSKDHSIGLSNWKTTEAG